MKYLNKHLKRASLWLTTVLLASILIAPTVFAAAPGSIGSWTTSPSTLPQGVQGAAAVTYNGYVYEIGGYGSVGNYLNSTYYAKVNSNGSIGSWTTSPSTLPLNLSGITAVTYNGYVYVMGGYNSINFTQATFYAKLNSDGSIGNWTYGTVLPSILDDATSVVDNGYIYVIGGYSGTENNTVYYAKVNSNGSIGSWTTSPSTLPQGLDTAASVTANGYVYVFGGETTGSILNTIYFAKLNSDGSVGSWLTDSNTLPQELWGEDAVTVNGNVYILGGYNGTNGDQSNVYYAALNSDGTVGSWTTSPNSLPQALDSATAVTYNNYVYVLGGQRQHNSSILNGVYYAYVTPYPVVTNSNSTSIAINNTTSSPNAPNTGFGRPSTFSPFVYIIATVGVVSTGVGIVLIYKHQPILN